ncbi:hypothetical protein L1049_023570 [Liquidambar formosana]|uniref:RING-type domain-containing protein n=1 Tax=Liquidambar formosana TaxID=63359 RepID=A0AAP0RUN6_LIQFO
MSSVRNWQSARDYGAYAMVPSRPRVTLDTSGGSWDFFSGSPSFPMQPNPPVRIPALNDNRAREVIPRPRQFVYESPPIIVGQRNLQVSTQDEFTLTQEQKNTLKKLKIGIYNPIPKRRLRFLYYRDLARISYNEKEKENDEDGRRCAICLEDFMPKEQVTLTPCNHMYHEDCIVPWVKSHGQCPVCRFAL